MKTTNKFDAEKRDFALSYKYAEVKALNGLKKMLSILDYTDTEGQLSFCYQNYTDDEAALSAV